jgi:serine/threonine-protein kinase
MALTVGTQLGSHEIIALLGKGGMGEVYRARDLKLKREVAIKILPDEFSRDPERVTRFQREAEVLASLNHPNIGAIYDLQEANDARFLVLELVEGETLADRIQRGPISVSDALEIARHICEALEAAHEKGIVHRDLKPANVKITPDGRVKVLDFGLAKALEKDPASTTLSNSPTLTIGATQGGMILGTAAYMSPEQAKGFQADTRSDVFSFGSVLFEMLSGRKAFQGETPGDVLASVIAREPDGSLLPPNLIPRLQEMLQRCLQKNPKRRWQAVGDLRAELETVSAAPRIEKQQANVEKVPLWKRIVPLAVAAVVFGVISGVLVYELRMPPKANVVKLPLVLPEGQQLLTDLAQQSVAISPDGTRLAYIANNQVFLRSLGEMEARPIAGRPGTTQSLSPSDPFFSPDGQWVGFYSRDDSTLKKIAVTGGAPLTICTTDAVSGVSWDGDEILFALLQGPKGIMRVPSSGGTPEELVHTGSPSERSHGPHLLDNGNWILYTATADLSPDRWDKAEIVVQSLKTGARKVLIKGGTDARYLPTGHLVYALGTTIYAVPFDVKKAEVLGLPTSVIEGVLRGIGGNTGNTSPTARFAVSANGTLVYVPGTTAASALPNVLTLVDRTGKGQPLPLPPERSYSQPRISPDGTQLAVGVNDGKELFIWIYDLNGSSSPLRLTFGGKSFNPIWTQDGRYITFESDRDGDAALYQQRADGSGPTERLTKAEGGTRHEPDSWNAKTLAFDIVQNNLGTITFGRSIWTVLADGKEKPVPLFKSVAGESSFGSASFSPDGRWIAYISNETNKNTFQVFVQPFPPDGTKHLVSPSEGAAPLWSRDGKQIIYRSSRHLVSVDVRTTPKLTFVNSITLPIEVLLGNVNLRHYDITPNGKQFIVVQDANAQAASSNPSRSQINVVLNWFTELQQRVPVK